MDEELSFQDKGKSSWHWAGSYEYNKSLEMGFIASLSSQVLSWCCVFIWSPQEKMCFIRIAKAIHYVDDVN